MTSKLAAAKIRKQDLVLYTVEMSYMQWHFLGCSEDVCVFEPIFILNLAMDSSFILNT